LCNCAIGKLCDQSRNQRGSKLPTAGHKKCGKNCLSTHLTLSQAQSIRAAAKE
jgi:hypothetical protein